MSPSVYEVYLVRRCSKGVQLLLELGAVHVELAQHLLHCRVHALARTHTLYQTQNHGAFQQALHCVSF